jgi:hypothetical protein
MPDIDSGVLTQLHEHLDENLHLIAFQDSKAVTPILALSEQKKIKDGFGKRFIVRFEDNEGAAVAALPDVADAIVADGDPGGRPSRDDMVITRTSLDSPFVFTRDELIAIAGMGKKEQFDVLRSEMENATKRLRNTLALQVTQKGWGRIAQASAISATSGDGTGGVGYVLVPDWHANRFRVGWRVVAAAAETSGVLYGTPAGTALRVTAVGRPGAVTAGQVKISLSGNPIAVWANNATMFLFRAGMRLSTDPGSLEANKKTISGLPAYVDPSATDTIWGVTRANNPDRTGHEVDCSGMDSWEALLEIAERAFMYGREMDTIMVSGRTWKLLNIDAQALKTVTSDKNPDFNIGFTAFEMATSFGKVHVAPDAFLTPGEIWAGPWQSKEFGPRLYYASDNLISLDNFDGNDFLRRATAGSRDFQGQMFFSGQWVLPCPGLFFKGINVTTT